MKKKLIFNLFLSITIISSLNITSLYGMEQDDFTGKEYKIFQDYYIIKRLTECKKNPTNLELLKKEENSEDESAIVVKSIKYENQTIEDLTNIFVNFIKEDRPKNTSKKRIAYGLSQNGSNLLTDEEIATLHKSLQQDFAENSTKITRRKIKHI